VRAQRISGERAQRRRVRKVGARVESRQRRLGGEARRVSRREPDDELWRELAAPRGLSARAQREEACRRTAR
jgi:hypothetical protein